MEHFSRAPESAFAIDVRSSENENLAGLGVFSLDKLGARDLATKSY